MKQYPEGWTVEDTGGGCQWLRKGQLAITDGEASLPVWGKPCVLLTLTRDGDYDELMNPINYGILEAAFADLEAAAKPEANGVYGSNFKDSV